jgi:uncharacterized membrane-anchored protein YhcB (DUF1043 family)
MDKIKTILILIAVVLGALGLLAVIGLVYSMLQFLMLIAVLGLAGYVGFRLFTNKSPRELGSAAETHLQKVERTLEEYKRKLK